MNQTVKQKYLLAIILIVVTFITVRTETTFGQNSPIITLHSPAIQDSVFYSGPFSIVADITDSTAVDTALIIFSLNSGIPDTVGMINQYGDTYIGVIDTIPLIGVNDTICYYIHAVSTSSPGNFTNEPASGCIQFVIYSPSLPPSCFVPFASLPYSEDFENGMGIWENETNDDIDWLTNSDGTPSNNTGPSVASSGTYYLYTEASLPNYPNKTAELNSQCIDISSLKSPKLEFFYHMYGSAMGSLSVDVWCGSYWVYDIWKKTGDQGDQWLKAEVNLNPFKGIIKLRIRSVTGTNYSSDIAIDDLKIWDPPVNDAAIVSIDYPGSFISAGNQQVKVSFGNFGLNDISSLNINWSINGIPQTTYIWAGLLTPCTTVNSFTIGTFYFQNGQSTIKVWTSNPNGLVDDFTPNDTAETFVIACTGPLSGSYTIGGPVSDFTSFTAATTALTNCGVNNHVVFLVDSGIYNEQFTIGNIQGSSMNSTVTFQSATYDSSDVQIRYSPASAANNFVCRFDSTSYVILRDLSFYNTSSNFSTVIELTKQLLHPPYRYIP